MNKKGNDIKLVSLYSTEKKFFFTRTSLSHWFLGVLQTKSYTENTSVCPSLFDPVGPSAIKLPVAFSCIRHRSSLQKLCFKSLASRKWDQ